jgi:hypothetical protein
MIKKPPNPLSKLHKVVRHEGLSYCHSATFDILYKENPDRKDKKNESIWNIEDLFQLLGQFFTEKIQSLTLKKHYL